MDILRFINSKDIRKHLNQDSSFIRTFAVFSDADVWPAVNNGHWYGFRIGAGQSLFVFNITRQDAVALCKKHGCGFVFSADCGFPENVGVSPKEYSAAASRITESIRRKNRLLKWSDDAIINCIEESVNETFAGKFRYYARSTLWASALPTG